MIVHQTLGPLIMSDLIHTPPSPLYIRVHILQRSRINVIIKTTLGSYKNANKSLLQ
jgi:hypothetical protein